MQSKKRISKYQLLVALLTVLHLVGCTTPGELRTKPPLYEGTSPKAPDNLAICIANGLEAKMKMLTGGIQTRPTSTGYVVSRVDSAGLYGIDTPIVIDIARNGSSTSIRAFSALPFAAGNEMILAAIRDCL